jgi:hypothetical protein
MSWIRNTGGTVMIYCGSGSYFRKVLFQFRLRFRFQFRIQYYLQFFNNINLYKFLPFQCSTASQKLLYYFLVFMLNLGSNPVPEPEYIMLLVPLRQKVEVPAVPATVPQHCIRGKSRRHVYSRQVMTDKQLHVSEQNKISRMVFQ